MNFRSLLGVVAFSTLVACGGGSSAVAIGTVTVGSGTFDIEYEGPAPTAGVMTNFVVKPTVGGLPDSVVAWIGSAGAPASVKVTATLDPADGDYDNEQTVPTTLTPDVLYYFDVTRGSDSEVGSIAFQGK